MSDDGIIPTYDHDPASVATCRLDMPAAACCSFLQGTNNISQYLYPIPVKKTVLFLPLYLLFVA